MSRNGSGRTRAGITSVINKSRILTVRSSNDINTSHTIPTPLCKRLSKKELETPAQKDENGSDPQASEKLENEFIDALLNDDLEKVSITENLKTFTVLKKVYEKALRDGGTDTGPNDFRGKQMQRFMRMRIPCNTITDPAKEKENESPFCKVGRFIADIIHLDKENPYDETYDETCEQLSKNKEPNNENMNFFIFAIFIFAILFCRENVAKTMWEKCNRQIGAALIASALLKKLSKIAKEETELELSKYTRQQSRQYEQKACDVLGKCFEENRSLAHKLLLTCLEKPFDSDDSTTIFDFAGANHLTTFMGHTCCQTKLSTIWRGQIAISTPWWKIVLLIFSPLFLPITLSAIKFRTLESPWTRRYIMGANSREDIATVKCNRCHKDTKPIKNDSSNISKNQDGQTKLQCEHCYKPLPNEDMLYRFSLCSGEIRFFDALFYLYTAPISAFWIHGVSYLFFLGLFSYFVVVDLEEKTTLKEWIIWGWIATFFFEELRQIANSKGRKLRKLLNWLRSGWNRFDLAMYIIFIITLCLRFTREGEDQFSSVRYFYSFTVAMFYIRFLQNFLVEKHIGLKVIMIEKMVFDLVVFLGIFLVFMQCFGIIYYANLYPNSPATVKLLQRIVYMPYWQIFGETYLEFLEGDEVGCTRNESIWRPAGGDRRCPEVKYWIPFIGGFYMLLTNVLLVNLLIAMFSYTFERIQKKSEIIWRFHLYSMMLEWYDRPFIPPPFIILAHVYRIVRNEIKKKNKWKSTNADFKLNHDPGLLKQLIKLEKKHAKDYVAQAKSCAFLKAGNVLISMSDEFQSVGAADLSEQPPYDTVLVLGTTSRAELL